MNKRIMLLGMSLAALWVSGACADDKVQSREQKQKQTQSGVQDKERQTTGRELMTPDERRHHRDKMRDAKNSEERTQMREKHHEEMKERAKKEGKHIPDHPPAGGMGGGRR